jgi:hypothetical protein
MSFLGGLLSSALPYLGRALSGAVSGVSSALQKGGGFGDVLKGGALGALSGVVGQPDETPRVEPRPVYDAPEAEPRRAVPVRRPRISIPQMIHMRKKKKATKHKKR